MSNGYDEDYVDAYCEFCRKPVVDMEPGCGHLVTLFETGWDYSDTTGVDVPFETPEALRQALSMLVSELMECGFEIWRVFDIENLDVDENAPAYLAKVIDQVRQCVGVERPYQQSRRKVLRKGREPHHLDWLADELDKFVSEVPDNEGASGEQFGALVASRLLCATANCSTASTGYRDIERGYPGFGSSVTYIWGKPRMKSANFIAAALRRDARDVRKCTRRVAKLKAVTLQP